MADAFVYCWTDIKESKLYVGWHKGTPDDGYVCSSKVLKEQYIKRPNDFTRIIIATGTVSDMVSLESALLKADGAATNHHYYNMHNNDGKFFFSQHTEAFKERMRGRKLSKETRDLISLNHADVGGSKNPMFGKTAQVGKKWFTDGVSELLAFEDSVPDGFISGRITKGKAKPPRTKEHSKAISEAKKGKPSPRLGAKYEIRTCPHCGTEGGGGNMTRHHFDNCRSKR